MGITAGSTYDGDYGHEDPQEVEEVGYSEDGDSAAERTGMSGTVDTSGVGPGRFEDLRHVTRTFDRSDERIASAVEDAESIDDLTASDAPVVVEGADPEATPAEIADALRERSQGEASDPANPASGDPEDAARVAEEARARAEAESGSKADQGDQEKVSEAVEDGSIDDLKEAVGDDPELAAVALSEEKAKDEDDQRKGAISYLEGVVERGRAASVEEDYDPAEHNAPEVVAYLRKVPTSEIERVQAMEAERKPQPRVTITQFDPTA